MTSDAVKEVFGFLSDYQRKMILDTVFETLVTKS